MSRRARQGRDEGAAARERMEWELRRIAQDREPVLARHYRLGRTAPWMLLAAAAVTLSLIALGGSPVDLGRLVFG